MWHRLDWPIPPDSEYLKRDSQSLDCFAAQKQSFAPFSKASKSTLKSNLPGGLATGLSCVRRGS